jgi:DNA-binding MarR family transcriptional regulator
MPAPDAPAPHAERETRLVDGLGPLRLGVPREMEDPAAQPAGRTPADLAVLYQDFTTLLERLHRRHLDVVRLGLEGIGVADINASQALLLLSIGDGEVPVRDLLQRGYYQASSASYNIKKLVDYGYLEQVRSPHDRRSVRLKLGADGFRIVDRLRELDTRLVFLAAEEDGLIDAMNASIRTMKHLDRLWGDFISFG